MPKTTKSKEPSAKQRQAAQKVAGIKALLQGHDTYYNGQESVVLSVDRLAAVRQTLNELYELV